MICPVVYGLYQGIIFVIIEEYHFGIIKINGITYRNDIRISPAGRILPEWWRKKGHQVEIEDLEDILANNVEIFVLGKGKPGLMKASKDLKQYFAKKSILLVEESTSKAVLRVNKLFISGKKFAAGFHLTC